MAVFRVEKTRDYTTMSNHHLRNKALSVKAKGLMSLMLSLPEDWDYTLAGLAKLNRDGVDSIRNAVQELEKAGYIHREFARSENGAFDGNIYTIHERPVQAQGDATPLLENATTDEEDPPLLDSPATDNPLPGKPLLENPTQLNTNRLNTKIPPIPPKGERTALRTPSTVGHLSPEVRAILSQYTADKPELADLLEELMDIRRLKKAVNSPRAVGALLGELERLSGGQAGQRIRLVEQSVTNSWKSVFALKDNYRAALNLAKGGEQYAE